MAIDARINGRKIKSDFEWFVYQDILANLPEGATVEYEVDQIPYVVEHVYVPDFKVTMPDGYVFYIEAKGNGRSFDLQTRQKMIAVRDQHKDIDIRIVFYSNGRVHGSKRRTGGSYYTQVLWAKKNNFVYSVKEVIKSWFKKEEE